MTDASSGCPWSTRQGVCLASSAAPTSWPSSAGRTRISATKIVHRVLPAAVVSKSADFEVTVRDGIVTISGPPQSEQAARALLDAARLVQGVVALRDRFT